MLEVLQKIADSITSFFSMLFDAIGYIPKFFGLVHNIFQVLNGLLVNMVPTWVGVFAIATIFIAILWIILEVI